MWNCGYKIDIPSPEYESLSKYQGSLGHKINHKFTPSSEFIHYDTPRYISLHIFSILAISDKISGNYLSNLTFRYGIVVAIKTIEDIKIGQEIFADYGYDFGVSPKWYRYQFRKYARENPTKRNLIRLAQLNEAEKNSKGKLKIISTL